MISVIIPLYNKEIYIEKCIQSVINQSFTEFELIIINDGSTDNSLQKIQKFIDTRIIIVNQENSGVSVTRNNGVALAKFELIAFLDADDWWEPDFLKKMKELIEDYPDAGVYGCNYFYVKNGTNKLADKGLGNYFTSGYIDYIKIYSTTLCVPINCSFVVVKKTIFINDFGFKPNLKFGEDFDLWIRLALKYKIAYTVQPLSYSNQDVLLSQRAIGQNKKWELSEHFIFNLDYLELEEMNNPDLKKLLDGLRMLTLIQFRINNWHKKEVQGILSNVDFAQQSSYYKRIYLWPVWIIKYYFLFRSFGSYFKQKLIHFTQSVGSTR